LFLLKQKAAKTQPNLSAVVCGVELSRCAEPTKVSIEYIILIETVKLKDVR
jgi:hypothetical protein